MKTTSILFRDSKYDVREFDINFRINYRAACVCDYNMIARKDFNSCKTLRINLWRYNLTSC